MKHYLLPEDARNGLIEYLSKRPYAEVAQGISALAALKEAPQELPAKLKAVGEEDQREPAASAA